VRLSNNGGGSWTTAGTQTTVATASYSTNGFTDICADVTTFVSGTISVTISTGLNTGAVGPAGPPGSGGGISSPVIYNQSIDAFNRTGTGLGANWTAYLNGINTTPGAAVGSTASFENASAYTAVTTVRAQEVRCSIGSLNGATDFPGCALEISGTPTTSVTFYVCQENSTTLNIARVVGAANGSNGVSTVLATTAVTGVAGDVLDFGIVGNTLTCVRNFATTPITLQVNDATPIATGAPGVMFFGNVATISSFTLINPVLPASATANIVFDGNSIIASNGNGSSGTDPATDFLYLPYTGAYVTNLGVSAKCLGVGCAAANAGTIETNLATLTSVINPLFVAGKKNILVASFICTNDLANGGRTTAQCLTDLTTYVTTAHAQGWKVIVIPEISRSATLVPATDVKVGIMSTLEVANSAGADAVVVLPISVTATGSSQDTWLFNADQVHPVELFHIDVLARALIATLSKF